MESIPKVELQSAQTIGDNSDGRATRKAKRLCLLGLLALMVVVGVLDPITADDRALDRALTIGSALIGAVLIVTWCHYDSWERSYKIGKSLRLLIIFFAAIGLPAYLFRTRGWRGLISIILAGLFFFFMIVVQLLASEVTCRFL
jgi:hypothetical protein